MSSVIKPARRRGKAAAGGMAGVGGGPGAANGAGGLGQCLTLRGGMTLFAGVFFTGAFLNSVSYYRTGRVLISTSSSSSSAAATAAAGADGTSGGVLSTLLTAGGDEGGYLPSFSLSSLMQLPSSLTTGSGDYGQEEEGDLGEELLVEGTWRNGEDEGPEEEEEEKEEELYREGIQINDLDLDEALRTTKEKIAAEKAKAAAQMEREKKEEEEARKKEEVLAKQKAAEAEAARTREEKRSAAAREKARAVAEAAERKREEVKEQVAAEEKGGEGKDKEAAVPEPKPRAPPEERRAEPAAESKEEAGGDEKEKQEEEEEDPEAAAADRRMRAFFEQEQAAALAWPSEADLQRTEQDLGDDVESGMILPVHPAKGLRRDPITTRPPLHRPRDETQIERILVMFSSTDRGQRIAHMWSGDKMETMRVTMASVAALCERGFDVTAWFIAAWPIGEEDERIKEALYCERIKKPIEVRYWDHFPEDIGGKLASRHRLAVAEAKDVFDFFISIEDDIHLTPLMFDAFVDASNHLALADEQDRYFPGFARKEHDAEKGESWSIWETDAEDYNARFLGPKAGWFATVDGNRHQAMWMATREQVYHLDDRCKGKFYSIDEANAIWVEWWSGALQLWDDCDGLTKVMPVSTFRNLTVWHMTDTKLYVRGKGVEPLENIVAKLEGQRMDGSVVSVGTEEEGKEEQ